MPCEKVGYLDQQSALNVVLYCVCRKHAAYLRIYFHNRCQRWHITKMRKEDASEERAPVDEPAIAE